MSRGPLRNGNPRGDLSRVRRCRAHRRDGQPCRQPAMRGRAVCRLHGGKAGAPKGPRNGAWRHGGYSQAWREVLAKARRQAAKLKLAIAAAKRVLATRMASGRPVVPIDWIEQSTSPLPRA